MEPAETCDVPVARLTVLGWPARPAAELDRCLAAATASARPGAFVRCVAGETGRHLVWRGRLPGGVLTLYEHLSATLSAHGLDAIIADGSLEIFVAAGGAITVVGAPEERDPDSVGARLQARVAVVGETPHEPAEAAADEPAGARTAVMAADDVIDFGLVEGAEVTLTERHDRDGLLEESWVACQHLLWRTEFLSPGTCRIPGESFDDSICWRVAQWRWTPADPDVAAAGGQWTLHADCEVHALAVRRLLPERLAPWVVAATEEGIELCEALIEGGEQEFAGAERRLRGELAVLLHG